MAFRDIIKKQRQSGKGFISSIGYASGASLAEKIDPRNILFKKGSLLNALFPNVKGFQASTGKIDTLKKNLESPVVQNVSNEELTKINVQLSVIGKNTMSLPIMMRDINVMRQSMVKLVRLQGGTQQDKADRFFSKSKEMESLYESNLNARKGSSTSPTAVATPKEKTWLEKIADFFGDGLLSFLLKSGAVLAIATGIGKYFTSPEFRQFVDSSIKKMFDTIDSVLKVIFGDDYQQKIKEVFLDIAKNAAIGLGVGIAAVVAVFATFQIALNALVAAVSAAAAKIAGSVGLPGGAPGVPDVPDRGKPGSKKPTTRPRDPKTGRFTKLPKAGGGIGAAGKALGIASILGLVIDAVYTSDDEITILRDAGFSNSKVFDKMEESDQQDYLEKLYTKDVKESELKSYRDSLLKKYNIEDTNTPWRWKERYVQKVSPTVVPSTNAEGMKNYVPRRSPTPSTESTSPEAISGERTFNALSKEEQDRLLINQANAEGSTKPGTVGYRHNNPGNIIAKGPLEVYPAQAKFGGIPGETITGPDGVTRTFVKFPSWEAGMEAQRDLWSRKYGSMPLNAALQTWAQAKGQEASSYQTASLGGLGQMPSNVPPTVMASAKVTQQPGQPSRPSTAISTPSITMADAARTQMQTPVVVNAPTTNIQQASNQRQGQYTSPAVVDSEFMKLLVSRVT